jgi:type II secretory pathway pseudopilin PulG
LRLSKPLKKKKAFGLLEVLLSGVIIIIILSSLMVVARNAVDNSILLQQRAQATYLAQEGIELVRQIRDTNYIDGDNSTGWSSLTLGARYLNYDDVVDKYILSPSNNAIIIDGNRFTRSIYVANSNGSLLDPRLRFDGVNVQIPTQSKRIRVSVSWQSKNSTKNIQIETMLTNSRQGF